MDSSLALANYCVRCRAACRYCLLNAGGRNAGVDYAKGKALARRLLTEANNAGIGFTYYIGFCMDTPYLLDYVRFCRENGFPSGRFLQMNGFHFMGEDEIRKLMQELKTEGVETMDFTFYGTEAYHDAFAGRKGDWALLWRMAEEAKRTGIRASLSVPVLKENADQMEDVIRKAERRGMDQPRLFLPHSKGRGWQIREQRITRKEYEGFGENVRNCFSKSPLKTEGEWIRDGRYPTPVHTVLTVVPNGENIEALERMSIKEIFSRMKEREAAWKKRMPEGAELAEMYGRKDGDQLFRLRDLLLYWGQLHCKAANPLIMDMREETKSFVAYLYE